MSSKSLPSHGLPSRNIVSSSQTTSSILNFYIDSINGMNGPYHVSSLKNRLRELNITVSDLFNDSVNIFVPYNQGKVPVNVQGSRDRLNQVIIQEVKENHSILYKNQPLYDYFLKECEEEKALLEKKNHEILQEYPLESLLTSKKNSHSSSYLYIKDLSNHYPHLLFHYKRKLPSPPSLSQLPTSLSPFIAPNHWDSVLLKRKSTLLKKKEMSQNLHPHRIFHKQRLCTLCSVFFSDYNQHILTKKHQKLDSNEQTWKELYSFINSFVYSRGTLNTSDSRFLQDKEGKWTMWYDHSLLDYIYEKEDSETFLHQESHSSVSIQSSSNNEEFDHSQSLQENSSSSLSAFY